MSKSEERRNLILVGASRLFLVMAYTDVTTADLEEVIGLSSGAIYYKVRHIEGLSAGRSLTNSSLNFCLTL